MTKLYYPIELYCLVVNLVAKQDIEFELRYVEILGPAKLFSQGGSMRLTLPRRMVRKHKLNIRASKDSPFYYVVVETDKGFLLVPMKNVLTLGAIQDALRFVDISSLDADDLKALFEEEKE